MTLLNLSPTCSHPFSTWFSPLIYDWRSTLSDFLSIKNPNPTQYHFDLGYIFNIILSFSFLWIVVLHEGNYWYEHYLL